MGRSPHTRAHASAYVRTHAGAVGSGRTPFRPFRPFRGVRPEWSRLGNVRSVIAVASAAAPCISWDRTQQHCVVGLLLGARCCRDGNCALCRTTRDRMISRGFAPVRAAKMMARTRRDLVTGRPELDARLRDGLFLATDVGGGGEKGARFEFSDGARIEGTRGENRLIEDIARWRLRAGGGALPDAADPRRSARSSARA